jgi:hypothetical protein
MILAMQNPEISCSQILQPVVTCIYDFGNAKPWKFRAPKKVNVGSLEEGPRCLSNCVVSGCKGWTYSVSHCMPASEFRSHYSEKRPE